ncbi:MAG TPA: D-alanine--D-alanine ligase family protein [Caldisericia bacterium]|nr:D-alanine--D-alanine ligase family protein [Caldisericia bacterium]
MKKRVGLFFGSKSVEHEISIITAMQVLNAIDKEKYEVIPIYIDKRGEFFTGDYLKEINNFKNLSLIPKNSQKIINLKLNVKNKMIFETESIFNKKIEIDIAFSTIHGTYGEDGKIQGIFEMLNIPYVGADVTSSALGMDKVLMKEIFKTNDLPIVNHLWIKRDEWENKKDEIIKSIEEKIKYPLFVKPANLGSSIGITKAYDKENLINGVEIAKFYDKKIIFEQSIENLKEINCSVLGNDEPIASVCEEVKSNKDFLDYESKYKSKPKQEQILKKYGHTIPANISDIKTKEIQELAIKAFKAIDCKGIARIDFLMDKTTEKVYVNEINTMPGAISFYLWEASGIPFPNLIDNLINLAYEIYDDKNKNITSIDSDVLLQDIKGVKRI